MTSSLSLPTLLTHILHTDVDSSGNEIKDEKPTGASQEWKQPAKTLNHEGQKRVRLEKRRKQASEKYSRLLVNYNSIADILAKNKSVEAEVISRTQTGILSDVTVETWLSLKPADKLKWIIHTRKFKDCKFHASSLTGATGKLNKTVYPGQTAADIALNCSADNPCLVWWAWKLCQEKAPLVLTLPSPPVLDWSLATPKFDVVYADLTSGTNSREPSSYLQDPAWVDTFKSCVRGVLSDESESVATGRADKLATALEMRLKSHVATKVDATKHRHWTLSFVLDNLPPMAAGLCLVDHVVDYMDTCSFDERLLKLPKSNKFRVMSEDLRLFEGCYLFYDRVKDKWIRSGKSAGTGAQSNFGQRGVQHLRNSKSLEQMKSHALYRLYPDRDTPNLGAPDGFFDHLDTYCAMAFDRASDLSPLCSKNKIDSLFVWSDRTMKELKAKGGCLRDHQLVAVAYLWELVYELLLSSSNDVSESPGFESFGLLLIKSVKGDLNKS